MNRLFVALGLYTAIAVLAWFTISDERFRAVTLLVLALFAVRTLLYSRRNPASDRAGSGVNGRE